MSTHKYLDETGLATVWAKIKALIPTVPKYKLGYDPNTTTGTATTGTATTTDANYTPSGDVLYETGSINVATDATTTAELGYSYNNYALTIARINATTVLGTSETEVVTAINGFQGSGVNLIIKEDE